MAAVTHPRIHRPIRGTGLPRPCRPVRRARPAPPRRHRAAAVATVAAVLLAATVAVGLGRRGPLTAPAPVPAGRLAPVARSSYVVQPGDTLWHIARALQPVGDVRPLVHRLAARRGGAALQPGELVVLS